MPLTLTLARAMADHSHTCFSLTPKCLAAALFEWSSAYLSTFGLNAALKDLFFASAIVRLWSSRARQSMKSSLSHVDNVTGSTHLRMRIATVHMINAATVQGRALLCSARVLCGAYSRAAFIRGAAFFQENTVCDFRFRFSFFQPIEKRIQNLTLIFFLFEKGISW